MAKDHSGDGSIKIAPCNCQHSYQDAKYGKGMRVHNVVLKGKKAGTYICTVCNTRKGNPW